MGAGGMAKLTKQVVDAAEAGSAAVLVWDDEVKGFGLRLSPGGSRSYVRNYRAGRDIKERSNVDLGDYHVADSAE
jgi:hypothetical protein